MALCHITTFVSPAITQLLFLFRDHKPAAEHHYLVIPKKHFTKIPTLSKKDIGMVRRMEKIGMEVSFTDWFGVTF